MPEHLPLLTHRIRRQDHADESTLVRQWRLLEQLVSASKGLTVKEMTAASGMSEKTVRRDIALLKKVGFMYRHNNAGLPYCWCV
jgi:Fic family protein